MRPKSLERGITVGLAVSLALLFALQWWVASASARRVVENRISSDLDHKIENLLSAASFGPEGITLDDAAVDRVYRRAYSGHYYAVHADGAELRSRSLWDADLPPLPDGPGRFKGPRGESLLSKTATFTKQGKKVSITVAEDMADTEAEIASFNGRYAAVAAVTWLLLLAAQTAVVRMALAPVERARRDAVRLERGETEKMTADVPAELAPFVAQINRLTDITRKRLARSRNALGDLAHSMKTHLTALVQAGDDPGAQNAPALRKTVADTAEAMQRLMERELKKARLAGSHAPGKSFSPRADVPPLLQTLSLIHRDKNIAVESTFPEGNFPSYDTEDMVELLGILLDNAYKWAKGRVRIFATVENGLVLVIEDDGPGCQPEEIERITQRGVRLDESAPGGYGLGLAIAGDIVESYNGLISFSRSERLGGLRVTVTLPA